MAALVLLVLAVEAARCWRAQVRPPPVGKNGGWSVHSLAGSLAESFSRRELNLHCA